MRRYFSIILLFAMISLCLPQAPSFSQEGFPQWSIAPLSKAYLEWEAQQQSVPDTKASPGTQNHTGYIPIPIDLSHLAANPPVEPHSPTKNVKISTEYDLRNYGYVPETVRNQNPYDTCWAHAAIGAMESNYMMQGYSELDLSEMHLAYFTFINPTKTKAFHSSSVTTFAGAMGHGGNNFYPAALYGRLDGPVLESDVPYGTNKEPLLKTPESYPKVLRLKEVYYLGMNDAENTVGASRTTIKQRIMDCGAVVASYYHNDSNYKTTTAGGTAYHTTATSVNHAVQIVGWNDNYSRDNFKNKPSSNGAWLMKNSWGPNWGNGGYFWMSYESYIVDGAAFVVEPVNPDLKCYYYDALGWTSSWGFTVTDNHAANAFKAERDGENLAEVGLYTPDNNVTCDIKVYINQGTSMPSTPLAGSLAKSWSETIPSAGYHTISLSSPIELTKGNYFSIVVKYTGQQKIPVEMIASMSPNVSIEKGSFVSYNGINWEAGSEYKLNTTIKAFTTSSEGDTAPTITTSKLPSGTVNNSYSAMISAYGKTPMTWSVSSGSLPPGLSLNSSSGVISGTPTEKGDFTFTIKAANGKSPDASKSYTITISDLPVISTTAFSGYAGFAISAQLSLNANISTTWAAKNLPNGLKLNAKTGAITGSPSKAGSYSATVTATTSAATITDNVTFTIYPKPEKAAIKATKLQDINIGSPVAETLTATGTTPITFSVDENTLPAGLSYATDADSGKIAFSGTPTVAGDFTIKVSMSNIVNSLSNRKADVKNIKFKVKAIPPVINAPDSLPDGEVGVAYSTQINLTSGTSPDKWTASGLPQGLTIGQKTGLISGNPKKYGKFNVIIQAQNNGGRDKTAKIPLTVYAVPEISMKRLTAGATGKKYSLKLTATGEPSSWEVLNLPTGLELSKDKNGNFLITGTPTIPETKKVTLVASNKLGKDMAVLDLVIKGVAPTINAVLPKTSKINNPYTAAITVKGTLPLTKLTCTVDDKDLAKANLKSLAELGLTFTADLTTGTATISGTPLYSVKGLPVQIIASNSEKENVKKSITVKVSGTKPAFTTPSSREIKETRTAGSPVAIDFVCTGTEKLSWSIRAVKGFSISVNDSDPHKATLTGTMPSSGKVSTAVTVENGDGKATMNVTLTVGVASSSLGETDTGESLTEQAESEPEVPEVSLTVGAERSAGDIGRAERDAIAREGYTVVAVLPELRAEADGMYDFDVELDENVEVGRTLVWLAFPQNAGASTDDEIAEFSDESGVETESVPESRKVKVSVWLREGVLYAPVIAVK